MFNSESELNISIHNEKAASLEAVPLLFFVRLRADEHMVAVLVLFGCNRRVERISA
ncbi:hypothetical protein J4O75_21825 [Paenibacillus pabuli]